MQLAKPAYFLFFILLLPGLSGCLESNGSGTPSSRPSTPGGVVIAASDRATTLQWNSVSGATGYNIYWSNTAGAGTSGRVLANVSSPYTHTSLTNGTTYYYVITAVNSAGESAPSAEVSATPQIPPPDTTSLQVTAGDQEATVTWSAVDGAERYNLYWSTVSGEAAVGNRIENVASPYVHSGLTNDVTYYYALTAVGPAGESMPSLEVGVTPSIPPYATPHAPADLGAAPLEGYEVNLPGGGEPRHYTLNATPGAVYMFRLDNTVDGARFEVFRDGSWDFWSEECHSVFATLPRCVGFAPDTGLFYIRVSATTEHDETVTLKVDEIVNEGTRETPVSLGEAPNPPRFGSVLDDGESVYRAVVVPGTDYRVRLNEWKDSGAARSEFLLSVFDGTGTDELCRAEGGGSYSRAYRGETIHCLATPTTDQLTLVTHLHTFGRGATYNIVIEEALTDGTQEAPLVLEGEALVHRGEVTADAEQWGGNYAHYHLTTGNPGTNYLVDVRDMYEDLRLEVWGKDAFTTWADCNSNNSGFIDESCEVTSGADGAIYARVWVARGHSSPFVLSAMPVRPGAVDPARYPNEGSALEPIVLSPVAGRLSTVGAEHSYYAVAVTPGSTLQVSATEMNANVNLYVYSDADYLNRVCASRHRYLQDDSCTVTVPEHVETIYVAISGEFAINNSSWSATVQTVGAMFRLTIEEL